jgi:hypothetical protein
MEIIKSIRPDKYGWLLPPHDINVVNGLIDEGKFNSVAGLGFIALTCSNCAATSGVYVEH